MKERIQNFLKFKGISQNEFAEMCRINSASITSLNKGLRSDKLAEIGRTFPELSMDYLLGLSDEMLRGYELKKAEIQINKLMRLLAENEVNSKHITLQNDFLMGQVAAKDEQIKFLMELLKKGEAQNISQSINM